VGDVNRWRSSSIVAAGGTLKQKRSKMGQLLGPFGCCVTELGSSVDESSMAEGTENGEGGGD